MTLTLLERLARYVVPSSTPRDPASILSHEPDGMGFHYGWLPDDHRQINVRYEHPPRGAAERFGHWAAYAGTVQVGRYGTKAEAETAAIEYLTEHPPL